VSRTGGIARSVDTLYGGLLIPAGADEGASALVALRSYCCWSLQPMDFTLVLRGCRPHCCRSTFLPA